MNRSILLSSLFTLNLITQCMASTNLEGAGADKADAGQQTDNTQPSRSNLLDSSESKDCQVDSSSYIEELPEAELNDMLLVMDPTAPHGVRFMNEVAEKPSLDNLSMLKRSHDLLHPFPAEGDLNKALSEFAPRLVEVLDEHVKTERLLARKLFSRRDRDLKLDVFNYELMIHRPHTLDHQASKNRSQATQSINVELPARQDLLDNLPTYVTDWGMFHRLWFFNSEVFLNTVYLQLLIELLPYIPDRKTTTLFEGITQEQLSQMHQSAYADFVGGYGLVLRNYMAQKGYIVNSITEEAPAGYQSVESYAVNDVAFSSIDDDPTVFACYLLMATDCYARLVSLNFPVLFSEELECRQFVFSPESKLPPFSISVRALRIYKEENEARSQESLRLVQGRVKDLQSEIEALKERLRMLNEMRTRVHENQAMREAKLRELQKSEKDLASRMSESAKQATALTQIRQTLASAEEELRVTTAEAGAGVVVTVDLSGLQAQEQSILSRLQEAVESRNVLQARLLERQAEIKAEQDRISAQLKQTTTEIQQVGQDDKRLKERRKHLEQAASQANRRMAESSDLQLSRMKEFKNSREQTRQANATKKEELRAKIVAAQKLKSQLNTRLENSRLQTVALEQQLKETAEVNRGAAVDGLKTELSLKSASRDKEQNRLDTLRKELLQISQKSRVEELSAVKTEQEAAGVEEYINQLTQDPAHVLNGDFNCLTKDGQVKPVNPEQVLNLARSFIGQLTIEEYERYVKTGKME